MTSDLQIPVLYAKIHRVRVTGADLHYEGSLSIDEDLMDAAGLTEFQQIDIYNVTNGNRLTTYAIPAERGSGMIRSNGAAAHLMNRGDLVIIAAYATLPKTQADTWKPTLVFVDENNRPVNETPEILPV
ncbi:MAG: aspartate 1-decarboxylase [Vampirovibrio sp.]|nr:aspartate 1-decarboxylase [Vampirovibrio sp.]